jgi:hypothetical protein
VTVRTLENPTLVLDLLEWVGAGARPYGEVMDAWQTSCPRLPIWEDALEGGLVRRFRDEQLGPAVAVTAEGRRFLGGERPAGRFARN